MARAPRARKSESLTIRLDPKARFILEYLARLKGQSITTVVERSIVTAADQTPVVEPLPYSGDEVVVFRWQDVWDISDGVRALKMASRPEFFPTYEEEKRLSFCIEHWPFFWINQRRDKFLNHYVDILWPRIDEFLQIHEEGKSSDYFAAGKAMQAALRKADLLAPDWPIPSDALPPPPPPPNLDEVPF